MAEIFRILERFRITGRGTVYKIKKGKPIPYVAWLV